MKSARKWVGKFAAPETGGDSAKLVLVPRKSAGFCFGAGASVCGGKNAIARIFYGISREKWHQSAKVGRQKAILGGSCPFWGPNSGKNGKF